MKQAAVDAMESGQPTDLRYGVVTSVDPLKIQITPQFILPESVLVVPQHLTNYEIPISVNWTTSSVSGGSGDASFASHNHTIAEEQTTITINNALQVDDRVALLRSKGGQSYFVLDKV